MSNLKYRNRAYKMPRSFKFQSLQAGLIFEFFLLLQGVKKKMAPLEPRFSDFIFDLIASIY